MKNLMILLAVCLSMAACNSGSNAKARPGDEKVDKAIVASNLYQHYVSNPQTLKDKDNNTLIAYAVDNNLDCKRTPNGVYYTTEKAGSGEPFIMGSKVSADYTGYLLDGTKFDSSYDRGQPIKFNVGRMIQGWNEWLMEVNTGTKSKLLIPSHLAYGKRGFGNSIPPDSPLVFEVEVVAQQ